MKFRFLVKAKFRVHWSGFFIKCISRYIIKTQLSFKWPLTQTNLQIGSCLPGKLDKGMPFALKGVSQLGSWIKDLFCATVATMFHSHLEWQSQCNGFPSIWSNCRWPTTSSSRAKVLRLVCSRFKTSNSGMPTNALVGNSRIDNIK